MMDFFENIFQDWEGKTWLVLLFLSALPLYIVWFVHIPSLGGGGGGFTFIQKIAVTIIIPIAIIFFINRKKG